MNRAWEWANDYIELTHHHFFPYLVCARVHTGAAGVLSSHHVGLRAAPRHGTPWGHAAAGAVPVRGIHECRGGRAQASQPHVLGACLAERCFPPRCLYSHLAQRQRKTNKGKRVCWQLMRAEQRRLWLRQYRKKAKAQVRPVNVFGCACTVGVDCADNLHSRRNTHAAPSAPATPRRTG